MANLKPNEVAEILGVTVKTLQRWDRDGLLKAKRTPTDRRYYTQGQIDEYQNWGEDDSKNMEGIIDRGYVLAYKDDLVDDCYEKLENGNCKVYLIDRETFDNSECYGCDQLYEAIFAEYDVESNLNGLEVNGSFIYNVILDYIINEYENGNKDAGDMMYPLLEEYAKDIKENLHSSMLSKIIKDYIIQLFE